MYDSVDTTQGVALAAGRWLLLIHQIPPKPDYFRVKVRRRLHRIGALPLKNSVYVLPRTDDAMEDFQWLRRAVVEEGGEVTICAAAFIEGVSDEEIEAMFRARSDHEYGEIIEAARGLEGGGGSRGSGGGATDADVRRLKRELDHVAARDFFDAPRAGAAERVVRELESSVARAPGPMTPRGGDSPRRPPRGATWVTRRGVHVDRMASAWLIERFIDPDARFLFVSSKGYEPQRGELRFDMFEGEFTHEGDRCTFEVLLERFGLDDDALRVIGEIVHDIDCKDEKFGRDEAVGVASVVRGISLAHSDDAARIEAAAELFAGLYAAFRRRDG